MQLFMPRLIVIVASASWSQLGIYDYDTFNELTPRGWTLPLSLNSNLNDFMSCDKRTLMHMYACINSMPGEKIFLVVCQFISEAIKISNIYIIFKIMHHVLYKIIQQCEATFSKTVLVCFLYY